MLERKELERRTIDILEKTGKQAEKYAIERKMLYKFSTDKNNNIEEWEKYLIAFENKLKGEYIVWCSDLEKLKEICQ